MSRRGNCHDKAVTDSFFPRQKRGKSLSVMFLMTSKCFIRVSTGMVRALRYHQQNMKTNIITGPKMSGLSVMVILCRVFFCYLIDFS